MLELVSIPVAGTTLHGIVHLPGPGAGRKIGVLLLGENVNTKFGTHRLCRRLADLLAQTGFYVLRYDNRGTCDSPGVSDLTFAYRVADARAAARFFRKQYGLESMLAWGLCMGAAVSLVCACEAEKPQDKFEGLVLCSILSDPTDVSGPEFGYNKVDLPAMLQDSLMRGGVLQKIRRFPSKIHIYRENVGKLISSVVRRYVNPKPELARLRAAIGRVGGLLVNYEGPTLMIFGENDPYRVNFFARVNPDDRLGLAKKKTPPVWAVIKGGDHTFSSREQTEELFRYSLNWLAPFLEGLAPAAVPSFPREEHGFPSAPVAD